MALEADGAAALWSKSGIDKFTGSTQPTGCVSSKCAPMNGRTNAREDGMKATLLAAAALAAVPGTFAVSQANAALPPCFGSPVFGSHATIFVCDVFLALEQASVNNIGASTSPVLFIGSDYVVPNGLTTSGVASLQIIVLSTILC
jgi:hypothetical protein